MSIMVSMLNGYILYFMFCFFMAFAVISLATPSHFVSLCFFIIIMACLICNLNQIRPVSVEQICLHQYKTTRPIILSFHDKTG